MYSIKNYFFDKNNFMKCSIKISHYSKRNEYEILKRYDTLIKFA